MTGIITAMGLTFIAFEGYEIIAQCYMFYRGLKRYGVEAEFVVYPREGHGIREKKHRLDLLNRILSWFDVYLREPS
jgi:dipeptidyl aminopeptidase/acylaminoacyl peptidase